MLIHDVQHYIEFVDKNNIDINELKDLFTAIVTADKLYGENVQSMSYDAMIADREDWGELLDKLGFPNSPISKPMPKTHKYRIMCDALTIYSVRHNLNLKDRILTCPQSERIERDGKFICDDYADETACIDILNNIITKKKIVEAAKNLKYLFEYLEKYVPDIKFDNLILSKVYESDWLKKKGIHFTDSEDTYEVSLKKITKSIMRGISANIDLTDENKIYFTVSAARLLDKIPTVHVFNTDTGFKLYEKCLPFGKVRFDLKPSTDVPGFRQGKAPKNIVEKYEKYHAN